MTENKIIAGYAVFFLVGIFLHLVPALSFIPEYITDLFLFAANAIVFIKILKMNRTGFFLLFFAAAWLITFFAEALGTASGEIFGVYHYGNTMKIQVLQVPLIIPFNWVMLVLGMTSLVRSLRPAAWIVPVLAALGLVLFDYTMEPVAMKLDYWNWQDQHIPFQNYLAWFIIALGISAATVLARIRIENRLLRYFVVIQWIFFLFLHVFFRFLDA